MADLLTEQIRIRRQIISAANLYQQYFAGKVFLYVYGDKYFEVAYMTRCFKHLAGVESVFRGESFYDAAKNATIAPTQISFSDRHPLRVAKKKVSCLHRLHNLTCDLICVVENMQTPSFLYKLGLTNLEFTIGLIENTDKEGNKINDWLVPKTLRVKDDAIGQSQNAEFIDFVFSKNVLDDTYGNICYATNDVSIPNTIKPMLSSDLQSQLSP